MAAVREERRLERERKQARVWVDPRAVFVCTNLKHWKMGKKKSSERYIGLVGADEGRKRDFGGPNCRHGALPGQKASKTT